MLVFGKELQTCKEAAMSEHSNCEDFQQTCSRLREADGLPFSELLPAVTIAQALAEAGTAFRCRIYTPAVTLWSFLSQVLSQDHSCRDAVARVLAWRLSRGLRGCSASANSYCE